MCAVLLDDVLTGDKGASALLFFSGRNSMASSLYSQSLISTYSVHALHTARRGEGREAAEGYLPDKLLIDAAASFIVHHEARKAGRAPSS